MYYISINYKKNIYIGYHWTPAKPLDAIGRVLVGVGRGHWTIGRPLDGFFGYWTVNFLFFILLNI